MQIYNLFNIFSNEKLMKLRGKTALKTLETSKNGIFFIL